MSSDSASLIGGNPQSQTRAASFETAMDDSYNAGWQQGYRQGEGERQALAIANSELRSQLRLLTEQRILNAIERKNNDA